MLCKVLDSSTYLLKEMGGTTVNGTYARNRLKYYWVQNVWQNEKEAQEETENETENEIEEEDDSLNNEID